jgi:hypothetical protein
VRHYKLGQADARFGRHCTYKDRVFSPNLPSISATNSVDTRPEMKLQRLYRFMVRRVKNELPHYPIDHFVDRQGYYCYGYVRKRKRQGSVVFDYDLYIACDMKVVKEEEKTTLNNLYEGFRRLDGQSGAVLITKELTREAFVGLRRHDSPTEVYGDALTKELLLKELQPGLWESFIQRIRSLTRRGDDWDERDRKPQRLKGDDDDAGYAAGNGLGRPVGRAGGPGARRLCGGGSVGALAPHPGAVRVQLRGAGAGGRP